MSSRPVARLAIFCSLVFFAACEFRTEAKLEGGNPPTFSIWSGTGKLWFASIGEYRPDKSLKPSQRWQELWSVQPARDSSGQSLGRSPSDIGQITYGVVPEGYIQANPRSGPPPPLVPGKQYTYSFKSDGGMPADGDFEIRDGGAVPLKIVHDCYHEKDGKEIETPCYQPD